MMITNTLLLVLPLSVVHAAFFLSPQQHHGTGSLSLLFRERSFIMTPQKDTDGPIMEEYNDFGDFIPGDTGTSSSSTTNNILQDRVDELRELTTQKKAQLAQNWQQGNWNVRGFSLDPYSAKDEMDVDIGIRDIDIHVGNDIHNDDIGNNKIKSTETSRAHDLLYPDTRTGTGTGTGTVGADTSNSKQHKSFISTIVLSSSSSDDDANYDDGNCVVGRSDGSVLLVELGTEYLARFDSQLTALETSNTTVKVESTLVRQDEEETLVSESPFLVTAQFMAHEGMEITALLVAERNHEEKVVVTATANGDMTLWSIPEDDDDSAKQILPIRNLDAHSDKVVAIKAVSLSKDNPSPDLLVSASRDGSIALWDLWTGDLIYKCQMQDEGDHLEITSLDAKDRVVFLGLATGHVVSYLVPEMVQAASMGDSCPVPNGRFLAHGETSGGVTSVACGGPGNLSPTSSILISGGADGTVKQWEILPRSVASAANDSSSDAATKRTVLEHWPRLATQRMPKRAHVFSTNHLGGDGDDSTITALASHGDNKIISASADGTVRAWCPTTGKELYLMAGFTSSLTSLCLNRDMLVTNGMNQFVCVHDFDVDQEDMERDGLDIDNIEW